MKVFEKENNKLKKDNNKLESANEKLKNEQILSVDSTPNYKTNEEEEQLIQ